MGASDDLLGIEAVPDRPAVPHAGDGGSGVDEDAVHVEQEGAAMDLGHSLDSFRFFSRN